MPGEAPARRHRTDPVGAAVRDRCVATPRRGIGGRSSSIASSRCRAAPHPTIARRGSAGRSDRTRARAPPARSRTTRTSRRRWPRRVPVRRSASRLVEHGERILGAPDHADRIGRERRCRPHPMRRSAPRLRAACPPAAGRRRWYAAGASTARAQTRTARVIAPARDGPRMASMDFAFSDEQEELRRTVRSFLSDKSPESEVRRLMDTTEGYEPKLWQQMGEQLGLQGSGHSRGVRRGRASRSSSSVWCSRRWAGRCCARPTSRRASSRPTRCCSPGTRRQKSNTCRVSRAARAIATLALCEEDGRWDEAGVTLAATAAGDSWTLTRHQDVRARRPHG